MKISIGSDHAGFKHRKRLIEFLTKAGYEVIDRGCPDEKSVDYPDYAKIVAEDVASKRADKGILICGTGIGMSIAANKVKGVRAALVHELYTAEMAAKHNMANVLCMGARVHSPEYMMLLVEKWLNTEFEERHLKRLKKIAEIESK